MTVTRLEKHLGLVAAIVAVATPIVSGIGVVAVNRYQTGEQTKQLFDATRAINALSDRMVSYDGRLNGLDQRVTAIERDRAERIPKYSQKMDDLTIAVAGMKADTEWIKAALQGKR